MIFSPPPRVRVCARALSFLHSKTKSKHLSTYTILIKSPLNVVSKLTQHTHTRSLAGSNKKIIKSTEFVYTTNKVTCNKFEYPCVRVRVRVCVNYIDVAIV